MDGISTGNLLFGLNQAKSIEHKLNRFISKKDTNGDNALSIKELGVNRDVFDRIDKNDDGQADKFEIIIAAHGRADAVDERINQLLSKKDTNGNGSLDAGELGVPEAVFKRIDKNGDGQVGIGELNIDARNKIAARNRVGAVNERISHLLSKKDTNGNGSLDVGELGMSKNVFNKIDKDGNGQVGRCELNAVARAAINNLLGNILPNKEPSKLDATA
jgi:hypothetical protein